MVERRDEGGREERDATNLRLLLDLDGDDGAVLGFALSLDIISEISIPVTFGFPVKKGGERRSATSGFEGRKKVRVNELFGREHVVDENVVGSLNGNDRSNTSTARKKTKSVTEKGKGRDEKSTHV